MLVQIWAVCERFGDPYCLYFHFEVGYSKDLRNVSSATYIYTVPPLVIGCTLALEPP